MPIVTAGALTTEKERETLALLLLTTLTPRQIVLQKYASRMTPIMSFVFLSFPLMAITYTFGGVTIEELVMGILLLVFTSLVQGRWPSCVRPTFGRLSRRWSQLIFRA